jgi:hypothetical protein
MLAWLSGMPRAGDGGGEPQQGETATRRGGHSVNAHPEAYCKRCDGPNVPSWFVSSPLWNAARIEDDIVCPQCFVELFVLNGGGEVSWELRPDPKTMHHLRSDLRAALAERQPGAQGDGSDEQEQHDNAG